MEEQDRTLGRKHLESRFMSETLLSSKVTKSSGTDKELSILPNSNIIMIGGRSIMDRGRKAVFPLVDELIAARKQHELILGVSGGVRVRHTYEIGLDLGLPTGGLAMITGAMEEQNSAMLYHLLAKDGGICLPRDCFKELPLYLKTGMTPILVCMPPHHYWEKPPQVGILPEYGSDFGIYMVAEVLQSRSMIFVKDVDGLYTDNPEKNPKAEKISKIHVDKLIEMDLPDLPLERSVLQTLSKSRRINRIQLVNGLKPGQLTDALAGKEVGTIIHND